GNYDSNTGIYTTAGGQPRFYFASDNLQNDAYKGLTPQDMVDIAIYHGLMYDGTRQEGVMFHLLGALSQYGKLGVVCVGSTHGKAYYYYQKVIEVLALECS
ncbi:MAG TPA: peptide ligase PGM1-related protein, partial [Panacibacter sp.]|nr:peptide ligase PGM1-related protein [Panacibacter sp.]